MQLTDAQYLDTFYTWLLPVDMKMHPPHRLKSANVPMEVTLIIIGSYWGICYCWLFLSMLFTEFNVFGAGDDLNCYCKECQNMLSPGCYQICLSTKLMGGMVTFCNGVNWCMGALQTNWCHWNARSLTGSLSINSVYDTYWY